ncbi:acyl-CoA dehydrogenase family protein [Microcella sp.]|uniref:acyl-CoA dehydrogenase family protein n=1 Tax=Microcella sp. TaxID=1913979 RepID=UPI00255EEC72|nr:acyl-CoA dehydrogenase family protein [Microcella sp.]MBX9472372.1 acyl-CoA dehydrogenase family protein [Microcella sp.]
MNLTDTPAEAAFRARVRLWLQSNAPEKGSPEDFSHGYGALEGEAEERFLRQSRDWQAKLADAGFAGLSWPKEYGGQGLSTTEEIIFAEEQSKFGVTTAVFDVAIRMIGPTIIAHATEEQKQRFLPPMLRGEEIWCQFYSEPLAGSDLASVRTTAVRDGDGWVVNGQKVWTSGATYCQWAMLLARTDAEVPKHKGLTCFFVDMALPGIDIRPLRQMTGSSHFNEEFFDDLRLPGGSEFGAVGNGWRVVLTTLTYERAIMGGGHKGPSFDELRGLALAAPDQPGSDRRRELIDVYIGERMLDLLDARVQSALAHGRDPEMESSVKKIHHGRHISRTTRLGLDLQGAAGMVTDGPMGDHWAYEALNSPMYRIAGGTDEIQRNILAGRILGVPAAAKRTSTITHAREGQS